MSLDRTVLAHLWLAVQIAIDLAMSACVHLHLGAPATYADDFRALADGSVIDGPLADRLVRAAGFRNVVAHADEGVDMARIYRAAQAGPADLRAFLAGIARLPSRRVRGAARRPAARATAMRGR